MDNVGFLAESLFERFIALERALQCFAYSKMLPAVDSERKYYDGADLIVSRTCLSITCSTLAILAPNTLRYLRINRPR